MTSTIELGWNVAYKLPASAIGRVKSGRFLSPISSSNFNKRISAAGSLLYRPIRLIPTDTFHKIVRDFIANKTGYFVKEKNFPYRLHLESLGQTISLSVRIAVYLPDILCLQLRIIDKIPFSVEALNLQRLAGNKSLKSLSDYIAYTVSRSILGNAGVPRFKNSHPIKMISSDHSVIEFENEYGIRLTDILIGRTRRTESDELSERIVKKNYEHNIKNEGGNQLLADKMSILLFVINGWESDSYTRDHFKKQADLYELSIALNILYSERSGAGDIEDLGWFFLVCCSTSYVSNYKHTFSVSLSNSFLWQLLKAEFSLDEGYRQATVFRKDELNRNLVIISAMTNVDLAEDQFWDEFLERHKHPGSSGPNPTRHNNLIVIGDITMGDNYSKSNIVSGSVGSGSVSKHANVQGSFNSSSSPESQELNEQLSILIDALQREADNADKQVAVKNVENALAASEADQKDLVNAYLRSAGKWVLGIAEKIGVAVAAASIRAALLP